MIINKNKVIFFGTYYAGRPCVCPLLVLSHFIFMTSYVQCALLLPFMLMSKLRPREVKVG